MVIENAQAARTFNPMTEDELTRLRDYIELLDNRYVRGAAEAPSAYTPALATALEPGEAALRLDRQEVPRLHEMRRRRGL